jgi:hypothetical protein
MEAWRLKMEARRVCRPVVADTHHLDEDEDEDEDEDQDTDQDPDPDPHLSDVDPKH